jgi:UDP-N-acetylmuramate--alanine ligase
MQQVRDILKYHHFFLVGIKGVAMTSLAQCLLDAGKKVTGSDVAEEFVTQEVLNSRHLKIQVGFETSLPPEIECVIFTGAHQGPANPQVQVAQAKGLPVFTQAEAQASLFNAKKGIAVCGVGGKSTTSAMITWILEKIAQEDGEPSPSFLVGVGNIPGINKTGQWNAQSKWCVAEADEYVVDPAAPSRGEEITPRFSFLRPFITVCTNLKFDHPDVYRDFEHTKQTYLTFFQQIRDEGTLVVNIDDPELMTVAQKSGKKLVTYGKGPEAQYRLSEYTAHEGVTQSTLNIDSQSYLLELVIPGEYNAMNATAAVAAVCASGLAPARAVATLRSFHSTMRRAEFIGEKHGVKYYDDYAHHPNEVQSVIKAFREWFPNSRLVVAFQSHTFSRTKALFNEFVTAFDQADTVVMIDIFASAREAYDPSITSELLCEAINRHAGQAKARNLGKLADLASYCQQELNPGDVFITIGAGDIYQVHGMVK